MAKDSDRATLIAAKEAWARERRAVTARRQTGEGWLPPGQDPVGDWPVLDLGQQPLVAPRDWLMTAGGEVERPLRWRWTDFMAQPQVESTSDIHCVTGWSRRANRWRGVATRHVLGLVRPRPAARHVVVHGYDGYTTSMALAEFAAEHALIAHGWEGVPLAREHGGPARLVAPARYFWKSAKWVRHVVFLEKPVKGFWEARGYHERGDPWAEERYG